MTRSFPKLKLLNMCLCQWLFFRVFVKYNTDDGKILGYGVLGPVLPLTGWSSTDYIGWNRLFYFGKEE